MMQVQTTSTIVSNRPGLTVKSWRPLPGAVHTSERIAAKRQLLEMFLTAASSNGALRRTIAFAMVLLMAVTNIPFFLASARAASPPATPPPIPELLKTIRAASDPKNLPACFDLLEKLSATSPRSAFDVNAKADELGKDIDKIFAFVRDQIAYEAYQGVLRGARGTLMAKAGNACDKALLLAELLRHHKIEVRFARGTLDKGKAEALVSHMFSSAKEHEQQSAIKPAVEIPEAFASTSKAMTNLFLARFQVSLETVRAALERDKVPLSNEPPLPNKVLVDEATNDHFWVEYKDGDKWISLDPSFKDAKVGQSFADATATGPTIPALLFHKITVRLVVEERASGQIKSREVLHNELVAADVNGLPVNLAFNLSSTTSKWSATPMFRVGEKQTKGDTFSGILPGMAGAAANLGRSLFGRRGKPLQAALNDITAVWLDFDFTYPSGRTESVRREIFDRLGPAARNRKEEATASLRPLPQSEGGPLPLKTIFGFSFCSGRIDPGVVLSQLAPNLPALRNIFDSDSRNGETESAKEGRAKKLLPYLPDLACLIAESFHAASHKFLEIATRWHGTGDLQIYEASPRLAIVSFGSTGVDSQTQPASLTLDLGRDEMRITADGVKAQEVISANIVRGIVNGTLESVMFPDTGSISTTTIFDYGGHQHIEPRTIPGGKTAIDIKASEDAKARIASGLRGGDTIISPERSVSINGTKRLGWWQINLQSGYTLAVMDNGLHQTASEREMVMRELTSSGRLTMAHFVVAFLAGGLLLGYLFYTDEQRIEEMTKAREQDEKDRRGDCAFQNAFCVPTGPYGQPGKGWPPR
jgi:Transglutaminase-like superfamily